MAYKMLLIYVCFVAAYCFCVVQVFFFKAQLQSGSVAPSSTVSDHAWLSTDELSKYTASAYYQCIKQFLLDI